MEGRDIMMSLAAVILISISLNVFYVDLANSNNLGNITSLDTNVFNRTSELLDLTKSMSNETGFLEDIPIVGDIAVLLRNSISALRLMLSLPGIFISMVAEAGGVFGVPAWIYDIISLFLWILIVFILISAGLRYRT
jgi:hypothetical protein